MMSPSTDDRGDNTGTPAEVSLADHTVPIEPEPVPEQEVRQVESRQVRTHRLSVGVLVGIVGIGLALLLLSTHGTARFALSNAFDPVQLPVVSLPGVPVVLICAVVTLAGAAAFLSGRLRGRWLAAFATAAGIAVAVGFLTWGAAGRDLPFAVSNQFAGTLALATPLIFGALCGVMCERGGVVNVAIEGQFLTAAFGAAVAGSLTHSITAAIIAAVVGSSVMAALLAVFSIKYLVNQVVLGVVLNLLASGLTGYLYDQLVQPASSVYNSAPIMTPLKIPLLAKIPFLGPVFFEQTVLAYLAFVSVALVWFLLFRTKWGLRVRAVGEHPEAADTVGISVTLIRWSAVMAGGIFAGLGGAYFTIGATGAFAKDFTVGNGFIALAALIMGRWHPVWAMVMALFFGFVTQLASQMQVLNTPVPSQFLLILPYVATIVAVAGLVGRVRAPAADGQAYEKS